MYRRNNIELVNLFVVVRGDVPKCNSLGCYIMFASLCKFIET